MKYERIMEGIILIVYDGLKFELGNVIGQLMYTLPITVNVLSTAAQAQNRLNEAQEPQPRWIYP